MSAGSFFMGFMAAGFWCANFVLLQEVLDPEWRVFTFAVSGWHPGARLP